MDATYPCIITIEVRFRDLDSMGHVNNAVYLTYMEQARVAYLKSLVGIGYEEALLGVIAAEITCTFKSPIFPNETVRVGVRVSHIGTKSIRMDYEIRDQATDTLRATARSVIVGFDYETQTSRAISPAFRRAIEAKEGRTFGA